jgi:RimJ/RimL family protein N-acetyltransferase
MSERVAIAQTQRLLLATWLADDRDLFREINGDPQVMEFFAFRRSEEEADALLGKLNDMISDDGMGFYAIVLKETGRAIGFCGMSRSNLAGIFPEVTVEIGWRLATRFWGKGYATEAAAGLLDRAFAADELRMVVSFAVETNRRSTAVMKRLGMQRAPELDFVHPRVPDTHPHLQRHIVYAVTRDQWLTGRQRRA